MTHTAYDRDAWEVADDYASQARDMASGTVDPFHSPGECGACDRARRDGAKVDEWHQSLR